MLVGVLTVREVAEVETASVSEISVEKNIFKRLKLDWGSAPWDSALGARLFPLAGGDSVPLHHDQAARIGAS